MKTLPLATLVLLLGTPATVGASGLLVAHGEESSTLDRPLEMAVSPDGRFLYAMEASSIAILSRDAGSGDLVLVDRVRNGEEGVVGLQDGKSLALTADGSYLYAAGRAAVIAFAREPSTGGLTAVHTEFSQRAPGAGTVLNNIVRVRLSANEKFLYVVDDGGFGFTSFARSATTGVLERRADAIFDSGDINDIAISLDGLHMYAVFSETSMRGYELNPFTGQITRLGTVATVAGTQLTLSPDGRHVYVAGRFLSVLRRTDGVSDLELVELHSIPADASAVAVTPDGSVVVVHAANGSSCEDLVHPFLRDSASGSLTPVASVAGVQPSDSRADPVMDPTGTHLYSVGAPDFSIQTFSVDSSGAVTALGKAGRRYSRMLRSAPGDRDIYDLGGDLIRHLRRDPATGTVTYLRSYRDSLRPPPQDCELLSVRNGAFSQDGRFLYLLLPGSFDFRLVTYERDLTTGTLTLSGVLGNDGPILDPDINSPPSGVAISTDGHLYVGGTHPDLLAVFSLDNSNGTPTLVQAVDGQVGDIARLQLSPGEEHLYAIGRQSLAGLFERNPTSGKLTFSSLESVPVTWARSSTLSRDGTSFYVGDEERLVVLDRNPATGELDVRSILTNDPPHVDGLPRFPTLAMSHDDELLYVHGRSDGNVTTFERDDDGSLSLLHVARVGAALGEHPIVTADGRDVYIPTPGVFRLGRDFDACSSGPRVGCRSGLKSALLLKDSSSPNGDTVQWTLSRGDATDGADLDPGDSNHLALCLWNVSGAPSLLFEARLPAASSCDIAPKKAACWKNSGNRFVYRDRAGTPDGISTALLRPGDTGKTKIRIKGRGAELALPPMLLELPVRAQLVSASGACWETEYDVAVRNDPARFQARTR